MSYCNGLLRLRIFWPFLVISKITSRSSPENDNFSYARKTTNDKRWEVMRLISSLNGHVDAVSFLWRQQVVMAVRPYVDLNPPNLTAEFVSAQA